MSKVLKIIVVIVAVFILLFFVYFALAVYEIRAANKEASSYCEVALIDESIERYKEKNSDKHLREYFDEGAQEYNYFVMAGLSFSVATCRLKVENGKIISKKVIPAAGS
ncbi:hypothetical protein FACS189441_3810 [Betaproteobacteria bacterium]|nr:hypothetical protein FACS189441_3810 [Betaproteobacteria bacterium]